MKKLQLAATFVLLLLPMVSFADGVKKDTTIMPAMLRLLTNERDTVITKHDTTFVRDKVHSIEISRVTCKVYDTVYLDSFTSGHLADLEDIGGGDDALDYLENEFLSDASHVSDGNANFIPASDVYPNWNNNYVNPYNINPSDIADNVIFNMSDFVYPLVKPMHVTSKFGWRRGRAHTGIDLKLLVGDTLVAPMAGVVRISQDKNSRSGYGKYIVIRHNNGLETLYGHLSSVLVEENQVVNAGDLIALGGNTGRSTGPHLHWEFRYCGIAMNPEHFVDFESRMPVDNYFVFEKNKHMNASLQRSSNNKGSAVGSGQVRYYKIKNGDTLGAIARRTGVSVQKLCSLNNISAKTILRVGRTLKY